MSHTAHDVVVATVATNMCAGVVNLTNTLKTLGWTYHVLGLGDVWTGFQVKMQHYQNFCASLPRDTVVVLVDSFDVLAVRAPKDFVQQFQSFQADIVCSAERLCGKKNCYFPERYWSNESNIHNGEYINGHVYLNSGLIVGKSQCLAATLHTSLQKGHKDDQLAAIDCLEHALSAHNMRMELDAQSKLFFNEVALDYGLARSWHKSDDGLITCSLDERDVTPWFVHFPSFMFHRVMLDPFQFGKPRGHDNYERVGKLVLPKGHFVELTQTSQGLVRTRNLILWTIVFLLVAFSILFLILYVRTRRRLNGLVIVQSS